MFQTYNTDSFTFIKTEYCFQRTSINGPISLFLDSEFMVNEDNIRAMLKYRIEASDTKLENYLKTSNSITTYIRYTIQNELI